jgi:hypothetical protein
MRADSPADARKTVTVVFCDVAGSTGLGLGSELGGTDERIEELGQRPGEMLAAAGKRALDRTDHVAAVSLLQRATSLLV